ncbi:hypothetical protein [Acaryochloris sp. IP29b_bin.148]|uniref:hypothetical protein n=1 Tax=Acaryochloris sp. IP29b_bin.148 TaxID=2969218 RepID=UPI0026042E3E|nr:hypothetical protein [Acaryochloris sp. IP29b_bin.148]
MATELNVSNLSGFKLYIQPRYSLKVPQDGGFRGRVQTLWLLKEMAEISVLIKLHSLLDKEKSIEREDGRTTIKEHGNPIADGFLVSMFFMSPLAKF